jgi:hypothetical protein
LASGCVLTKAPKGWLSDPEDLASNVRGGWIEIEWFVANRSDRSSRSVEEAMGELIAVHDDSLYVLTSKDLHAIAVDQIKRSRLFIYDSHLGSLQSWAFAGLLSTMSHGVFLILSAPMWLISGIAITASHSRQPLVSYDPGRNSLQRFNLDTIRAYSRFPQGMPKGFGATLRK